VLANNTIDNVIVGRLLGAGQLGYYTVTYRVATMPDDVIGYIVGRVMFPVYSRLSEDKPEFGRVYVQNLQRVALLSLPASVGVIVAAEPIVRGLLGEKWLLVVTPLRLLAVYALVRAVVAPSGEVFKGAGKPHLLTAFSALHLSLSIPFLLVLVPRYELKGAALGMLAPMVVVGIAVFIVGARLLEVELSTIARALAPSYVCAGILGFALLPLLRVADALPPVAGLAMLVVAGICIYVGSTAVFARSVVVPMWAGLRRA
jgi:PST family polysaccharide transporter